MPFGSVTQNLTLTLASLQVAMVRLEDDDRVLLASCYFKKRADPVASDDEEQVDGRPHAAPPPSLWRPAQTSSKLSWSAICQVQLQAWQQLMHTRPASRHCYPSQPSKRTDVC